MMLENKLTLRLAAPLQFDSIVDGEGLRTVLWTQGCARHCPGCHNPETWDLGGGFLVSVEEIKEKLAAAKLQQGITFSGGEPFLQAAALCEVADFAHSLGLNVWSFSGYTYEQLLADEDKSKQELLKRLDVLVDGAFMIEQRDISLRFRGSRNQRLLRLKNGKVQSIE